MATCNRCGCKFIEDDFVISSTGFCRKCYMERVAELEQVLLSHSINDKLAAAEELARLRAVTARLMPLGQTKTQPDIEH